MSTVILGGDNLPARQTSPTTLWSDNREDIAKAERERDEAKRLADSLRRGRNAATLWLILLIGALVAAGAFIGLLLTRPAPTPAPGEDPAALRTQIQQLQTSLTTSQSNFDDLQKRYETFSGLPEAENKFKDLSVKIRGFVEDTATYGDIKARTIRAKPTPTKDQWAVYETGRPIWRGEDAAQVKAGLEQQVRDLEGLLTQINATGPVRPTTPTPCVGPNC